MKKVLYPRGQGCVNVNIQCLLFPSTAHTCVLKLVIRNVLYNVYSLILSYKCPGLLFLNIDHVCICPSICDSVRHAYIDKKISREY